MRAYERLLKYVGYETASDDAFSTCPSTASQLIFARVLEAELRALGAEDISLDDNGYLFATIPATTDKAAPVIGFLAHLDTVRDVPFDGIKPQIIENYDGGDIVLKNGSVISSGEFPFLPRLSGSTLITTDGNTLLGADDKAGIAAIMTMAETLLSDKTIEHGKIRIGFTPDEEIGRGADLFDVARFGADYAYTADGSAFGEVEYETFNAASAEISFTGRNIHPGAAKGKMKSAMQMAMLFDALLPADERPEHTEDYQGFYHLTDMRGTVENAELYYILRDHDRALLEERKANVLRAVETVNAKFGQNSAAAVVKDSYYNMAEMILPHPHLLEFAFASVRELGAEPICKPVRGGTDGSRLSYMGLPCPNLGTGAYNYHSRFEFACVEEMDLCVKLLIKIGQKYVGFHEASGNKTE